jgi:hypothetical protein
MKGRLEKLLPGTREKNLSQTLYALNIPFLYYLNREIKFFPFLQGRMLLQASEFVRSKKA